MTHHILLHVVLITKTNDNVIYVKKISDLFGGKKKLIRKMFKLIIIIILTSTKYSLIELYFDHKVKQILQIK